MTMVYKASTVQTLGLMWQYESSDGGLTLLVLRWCQLRRSIYAHWSPARSARNPATSAGESVAQSSAASTSAALKRNHKGDGSKGD